ncbi:MAG: methyltransferase [Actinomycetia bacterium]|nr:methyltransferase [Actinomycetes bacterium]
MAAEAEAAELVAVGADEAMVARRERGEPLAWVTGSTLFCGRRVRVRPGVYVPRVQTEELAVRAAAALPPGGRAVDLCTGAGAVAAHLRAEVPTAVVLGVDVDPAAAACARSNGVPAVVADLDAPLRGTFDVVTAVAPYVPTPALALLPADVQRHEPRLALDGGDDGLDLVRRVVDAAVRLLRPGGALLLELGGEQDRQLDLSAFRSVEPWWDEDGDLRGVAATS